MIQKIRLFSEVWDKCMRFMDAFGVHPKYWSPDYGISIKYENTQWTLAFHMDMGQFLGFCLFVSGICLSSIALKLVILVETNDKRCESPCFSMLRLRLNQWCFWPVEIHMLFDLVHSCDIYAQLALSLGEVKSGTSCVIYNVPSMLLMMNKYI